MDFEPYHHFTKAQWSRLRDGEEMTLTAAEIDRLRSLSDPISLTEAEEVYLPLSRLLSFYVEAIQDLHSVSTRFLNRPVEKVPVIIGVAGSVAVGKSTTAVHVAIALDHRGARVAAIDLDHRQRTLTRYLDNRAETCARREIREELGCELVDVTLFEISHREINGAPDRSHVFTARLEGEPRPDRREVVEAR